MKNHKINLKKSAWVVMTMITDSPGPRDEEFGDADGQEINKDPIIGGADDVYRENPTDDLGDSDIVDAEPLQEDIKHLEDEGKQTEENQEKTEESDTPTDSEEENLDISNLEDNEDITDGL